MNQAVFEKIWINEDGLLTPELATVCDSTVRFNKCIKKSPSACADSDSAQKLFKPDPKFFEPGLNNEVLVGLVGLEPMTFTMST